MYLSLIQLSDSSNDQILSKISLYTSYIQVEFHCNKKEIFLLLL